MARSIDLLVPGLFGPIPLHAEGLPGVPALERIIGRADRLRGPAADPLSDLLSRFGIPLERDLDPPSAPFCRLADDPDDDPSGYWLHADPVHLRPGPGQLVLLDARHLGLTQGEADTLTGEINALVAADGMMLVAPVPERWYLRLDDAPAIRTAPLHVAAGRGIGPLLPTGKDAKRWSLLLNEIQMLLHHSSVNRSRERAGRLTVNGLWPWGGGRLPEVAVGADIGLVLAGHPLARGLARAAGVVVQPLPDVVDEVIADDPPVHRLIFWDSLWPGVLDSDALSWLRGLERLECLAQRLLAAVRNGSVARLDLDPCDGNLFRLTAWGLRRFWRPVPSYRSRLGQRG